MSHTMTTLRCRVAGFEFLVPTTSIAQVIECDVDVPPPLAAPWLEGLGVHAGSVVVATRVCFDASSRTTRGAVKLIALAPRSSLVWSVAVDEIGAFVTAECRVELFPRPGHPPWLRRATLDGVDVAWLDAASMRAVGAPR